MDHVSTVLGSQFLLACWMPAWKKFHFDALQEKTKRRNISQWGVTAA